MKFSGLCCFRRLSDRLLGVAQAVEGHDAGVILVDDKFEIDHDTMPEIVPGDHAVLPRFGARKRCAAHVGFAGGCADRGQSLDPGVCTVGDLGGVDRGGQQAVHRPGGREQLRAEPGRIVDSR